MKLKGIGFINRKHKHLASITGIGKGSLESLSIPKYGAYEEIQLVVLKNGVPINTNAIKTVLQEISLSADSNTFNDIYPHHKLALQLYRKEILTHNAEGIVKLPLTRNDLYEELDKHSFLLGLKNVNALLLKVRGSDDLTLTDKVTIEVYGVYYPVNIDIGRAIHQQQIVKTISAGDHEILDLPTDGGDLIGLHIWKETQDISEITIVKNSEEQLKQITPQLINSLLVENDMRRPQAGYLHIDPTHNGQLNDRWLMNYIDKGKVVGVQNFGLKLKSPTGGRIEIIMETVKQVGGYPVYDDISRVQ